MKIAIHQPHYWPWIPYFQKILKCDIFVYLDSVQFSKNGYQNRNQVRGPTGPVWLSVPVRHEFGQSISEVALADRRILEKHYKILSANYSKAPGFLRWKTELENLFLQSSFDNLADLAINTTEWCLQKLSCSTRRIRSSELGLIEGQKSFLVSSICKRLDGTSYISGPGALDYMNMADFKKIKCEILLQKTQSFTYAQSFKNLPFTPALAALDLILNCPDEARGLIDSNCEWQQL